MDDNDSDFETVPVNQRVGKQKVGSTETNVVVTSTPMKVSTEIDNDPRRTYLVTYSQANKIIFPTRESFATKCEESIGGGKRVSLYACAEESHEKEGTHYHVSIKLTQPQR